jgi:hypothetical protein
MSTATRDVRIREMRSNGATLAEISARFSLSRSRASEIARGGDARSRKAALYSSTCPGCGVMKVGSGPDEVGTYCKPCRGRLDRRAREIKAEESVALLRRLGSLIGRTPLHFEWTALAGCYSARWVPWPELVARAGLEPRPIGAKTRDSRTSLNALYGVWETPRCTDRSRERRGRVSAILDRNPSVSNMEIVRLVGCSHSVIAGDLAWLATARLLPAEWWVA